jgi:hypothetical protein
MRIKWILSMALIVLCLVFWDWFSDHYEFAVLDSSGEESFIVQIPKASIGKYSGWKYNRNGPVSIDIWYPSLQDKVSANRWVSSSTEIKESKNKPTKDDRQLSISIGWDTMISPKVTLDTKNRYSHCKLEYIGNPYIDSGVVGDFRKYTYHSKGSLYPDITYIPKQPIKGIRCISCRQNANCRIYGITDASVPYQAVYTESEIPKEVMAIHSSVESYLESKRVN